MENNDTILQQLKNLHEDLNKNRIYTEYTANEGRRYANIAISLIKNWNVDESNIKMKSVIPIVIAELELAIRAAKKYYDNYDFIKRKAKSSINDPFESIKKAQGAIEIFLFNARKNI